MIYKERMETKQQSLERLRWGREGVRRELWSHLSKFSLVHKPLLCTKYLGDTVALYLVPFYACGWALNPSPTPPSPFFFPLFVSFSNLLFPLGFEPSPFLPSFLPPLPTPNTMLPTFFLYDHIPFLHEQY